MRDDGDDVTVLREFEELKEEVRELRDLMRSEAGAGVSAVVVIDDDRLDEDGDGAEDEQDGFMEQEAGFDDIGSSDEDFDEGDERFEDDGQLEADERFDDEQVEDDELFEDDEPSEGQVEDDEVEHGELFEDEQLDDDEAPRGNGQPASNGAAVSQDSGEEMGAHAVAVRVARSSAEQLTALTGRASAGIAGMERSEQGWRVLVETTEVSRSPVATDVIGLYEVFVDDDGDVQRYQRLRQYVRSRTNGTRPN